MKHPRTRTGGSLVGLVLVLLGLSTYGCGDTGTQSQPAELGGLSVSPGSLQPSFNPATTSYTATVSSNVSSTIITASPRVAGDAIRIDNQQTTSQTITLDAPGAEKSINIVVTDTGTGGTSKSYTIRIKREVEDTTLTALSVSPGTLAPSTFDKNTPDYTVNEIDNAVTSVTISATKSNPDTVMQIDTVTVPAGVTSGQANVRLGGPGSSTKVSINVTTQSGAKNTYTVTINRGASDNNFLRSLSLSSGSTTLSLVPRFNQAAPDYTVNVASNIGSVSVTARVDDATARMKVNAQDTASGQARSITLLPAGQDTPVLIEITAQNNTPPRRYSVNVKRAALGGNNNLQSLAISPGTLDPSFTASTTSYTVPVPNTVTSVTVTPRLQDASATMTVNGQATNSGQARTIDLNGPGSSTIITIVAIAQNGTSKPYSVRVAREALGGNNSLQSLAVSPGALDPAFTANTTSYTVDVNSTATSLTVTPRLQDSAASLQVNGQVAISGQPRTISLNGPGSDTIINIVAIAQNGSQKPYLITVTRAALGGNSNLQSLAVSPGALDPAFTANTTSYTVDVNSTATSLTVTPRLQDSAASLQVNGQVATSGQSRAIPLNGPGSDTIINIVAIAQNGSQKLYSITVNRAVPSSDNNLSDLRVRVGNATQTLTPSFDSNALTYTVNVPASVPSVSVTATKADPNAVISGDLPNSGQATIQLDGPGTSTVVSIIVTAANGTTKTYAITINRAAPSSDNNLSALSVSQGSLAPVFSPDTLAYSMDVTSDTSSVSLAATKADPNAVISGNLPNSGQATIQLDGPGTSTVISIIVTAANGTTKTYAITINRAAAPSPPAKPATAPDLIATDDSCFLLGSLCFPPTSNTDNITNVKRPGFSVPRPGSGETAKLYMNGSEVPSSVTENGATSIILRPNNDLLDGSYNVTYTLSNSVGESDKSPIMTPQLEINTVINN